MTSLVGLEKKINSELTTKINESKIKHGQLYLTIDNEDLLDVILFLKTNKDTKFRQLIDITAVDYLENPKRFKIVYLFLSHEINQRIILNYFINENESIGSELPKIIKNKPIAKPLNDYANRITHFQKFSEYLLKSNFEHIETRRKKGIKIQLQKMAYDASEVYLVIEVKNKSGITFEIDYLNVYRTNGNNKRKASYQSLQQDVIYKHKMPYSVTDGKSQRFVYVIPKFVLGDNEKLMLELKELKGSRKVVLETKI